MINKNKIVVTGGSGRVAQSLKKTKCKYKFIYPDKKQLDITNPNSIERFLKKNKPRSVLHLAGLSRPLVGHETNISKSISLNIIGTANLVNICSKLKIKLVYFSTSYVYPGKKGNYKEYDAVLPWNNYGWSKLGGECAVQMYKNSLILRVCMTEKPFVHKKAFYDFNTNFIFHDEVAKILFKLINKKGIVNLGGKAQTVYRFVKKFDAKIKKIYAKKILGPKYPLNPSMNIAKLKKILK